MKEQTKGRRMNLIFDADDTLWENNVVFESVIEDVITWLEGPGLGRGEIRATLDDIERRNMVTHGFGTKVFRKSLEHLVADVRGQAPSPQDLQRLDQYVGRLQWTELEIIQGVPETLAELGERHDLLLLTKGDQEEQQGKINTSGLAPFFKATSVVPAKEPSNYQWFVAEQGLDPRSTWMIGNSLKSDVHPALKAGLGAVYVPHSHTWRLEHAELPESSPRFTTANSFAALREIF